MCEAKPRREPRVRSGHAQERIWSRAQAERGASLPIETGERHPMWHASP
jgi:hypothetical protein